MKTVLVNQDGSVSFAEVNKPKIKPTQAMTKTIANGICGTDVHLMKKKFKGITPDMYPIMLGHENVGEVVEVGSECKTLKVGDKVLLPFLDADKENVGPYESAWGACSEYCVVNDPACTHPVQGTKDLADAQCKIPDWMDPVDAVMLVTFGEVLSSTRYFGVEAGKPVVIYGAGPVGLTFIKMCKMIGADPVISVVRNEVKAENAKKGGADIVINSSEVDVPTKVKEMYPGGVTHVIDAVGSTDVVNEAMALICDRGNICGYGVPTTEEMHLDFSRADYNWNLIYQQMPRKDEEAKAHDDVIEWIKEGKINPKDFISDYFTFEESLDALQMAYDRKITKKGIVVYK